MSSIYVRKVPLMSYHVNNRSENKIHETAFLYTNTIRNPSTSFLRAH